MNNLIESILKKSEDLDDKREKLVEVVETVLSAARSNTLVLESGVTLIVKEDRTSCGNYSVLVCSNFSNSTDLSLRMGVGAKYIHGDFRHEWGYPTREEVIYFLSLADDIEIAANKLSK